MVSDRPTDIATYRAAIAAKNVHRRNVAYVYRNIHILLLYQHFSVVIATLLVTMRVCQKQFVGTILDLEEDFFSDSYLEGFLKTLSEPSDFFRGCWAGGGWLVQVTRKRYGLRPAVAWLPVLCPLLP